MEIADIAFSTVLLLGLAVIFASSKFMKNIHVCILLILIELCIDYKRQGVEKGSGSKGDRGSYRKLIEMNEKIPFQGKELLLISQYRFAVCCFTNVSPLSSQGTIYQ